MQVALAFNGKVTQTFNTIEESLAALNTANDILSNFAGHCNDFNCSFTNALENQEITVVTPTKTSVLALNGEGEIIII